MINGSQVWLPAATLLGSNPGQVVHIDVPLSSLSNVTWYQSRAVMRYIWEGILPGRAESNSSLLSSLWHWSPAGWLFPGPTVISGTLWWWPAFDDDTANAWFSIPRHTTSAPPLALSLSLSILTAIFQVNLG